MPESGRRELDRVFREEHGRVIATLARRFGDIDIAEEAAQEAYLIALQRWSELRPAPDPGPGYHNGLQQGDRPDPARVDPRLPTRPSRHDQRRRRRRRVSSLLSGGRQAPADVHLLPPGAGHQCADRPHPPPARRAERRRNRRAFLVDEAAMAKRLTRSKQKIKAARIPYRVPADAELPGRLRGVLATLFLVFNEGLPPVQPDRRSVAETDAPRINGNGRSRDDEIRGEQTPHRPVCRGHPIDQNSCRTDAGRARGARPARADAADGCAPPQPVRRRRTGGARGPGPFALGSRPHRRGARHGP